VLPKNDAWPKFVVSDFVAARCHRLANSNPTLPATVDLPREQSVS
jgi:hypothetical protein